MEKAMRPECRRVRVARSWLLRCFPLIVFSGDDPIV
jgi:hypothetical protein